MSTHAQETTRPVTLHLTGGEMFLLRSMVEHEAKREGERSERMHARPKGSHDEDGLRAAAQLAEYVRNLADKVCRADEGYWS